MRSWARGIFFALALLSATMANSRAQDRPDESPILLTADQVTYDEELGIVTASGNVEVAQGGRVLQADTLTYNERAKTVTASGNVALLEPSGDVLFADYVELTDDLEEGIVENIRLLMADRSRAAAARGIRTSGNRTVLEKAVFSPCELCPEDPTRAPLWQIKAVRVVHDQEEKTIEYQDAWMEIFGVPIAYTPYFSHPDPTVDRKSGFLSPTLGLSDTLGFNFRTPYYINIAPDKDATVTPLVTTRQSVVLLGEYRQRFNDGEIELGGSGTVAERDGKGSEFRGHIDSFGRFDIDEHWRWGFDANRATDKTYLRFYDFDSDPILTSRAFTEGFYDRNYASIEALAFQGTRSFDNNEESPIITPLANYHFISEPDPYGGHFTADANFLVLSRIEGRDSRRLSLVSGWTRPYVAPAGDIYRFGASLQSDVYWVDGVDPDSDQQDPTGDTFSGVEGRLFPQAFLEWRYPFVRHGETLDQVVEPIASVVVGPNNGNPDRIPNEDSLDIEFDDTSLFRPNRFTGRDRVDTGQRINYGLQWSGYGRGDGYAEVFLGQSYQLDDSTEFPKGSGLEDNLSDIVGRLEASPHRYLDLLYRFRFSAEDLDPQRNEVRLRAGPPVFNLSLSYAYLNADATASEEFDDREEISGVIRSRLTENWSAFVTGRRDIAASRTLSYGGGVGYADDCFDIRLTFRRNFYRNAEIEPETAILLTVGFKYLGAFGAQF
jgi:LPS-assembly protein